MLRSAIEALAATTDPLDKVHKTRPVDEQQLGADLSDIRRVLAQVEDAGPAPTHAAPAAHAGCPGSGSPAVDGELSPPRGIAIEPSGGMRMKKFVQNWRRWLCYRCMLGQGVVGGERRRAHLSRSRTGCAYRASTTTSTSRPQNEQDSLKIIEEIEFLVNLRFEQSFVGLRWRPTLCVVG
jgi:hypothetical protein